MVFATYRQILAAPMPQGGLFLSNRMSQALMFSCDCRWGVLGMLWCNV